MICASEGCDDVVVQKTAWQVYCSATCRNRESRRRYQDGRPPRVVRPRPLRVCHREDCDNLVTPKIGGRGSPKLYCSTRCTNIVADRRRRGSVPRDVCHKCRTASVVPPRRVCADCFRTKAQIRRESQYGLTPSDYERLLADQGGLCKFCDSKATHVDHDHGCCSGQQSCGKCVRWLLCHSCNVALGLVKDDLLVLHRMQSALTTYKMSKLTLLPAWDGAAS